MSGLLLDTSAVVGCFERRDPTIIAMISRASTAVSVSVLTLGELEHGVRRLADADRGRSLRNALAMQCVDVDAAAGPECFGFVASQTSRRVGDIDRWIVTTAVIGRFELVTQDQNLADQLATVDWSASSWKAPTVTYVAVAG